MTINKKIRILIVDDSLVFRELLAKQLSKDPSIKVIATAEDPFDARDKILDYQPDVMLCDVEMPKMNGIEFIRRLLPQYPLPVIVVSTVTSAVFDALSVGAVDFVSKPAFHSPRSVDDFIDDLIAKIKIAVNSKVSVLKMNDTRKIETDDTFDMSKLIAIGASTGGTEAIASILSSLPHEMPGILIVQHIPPVFSRMFAERMNEHCLLNVKEAEHGDYVEQGKVLIAPGAKHMKVKKVGKKYKVNVFEGEKVNGHCPSVDTLFESVAKEANRNAVGIILTGMGYDGAKGLLSIRRKGGRTIGQDEKSSVVYGMPKVAFNIGAVESQVALHNIPKVLLSMIKQVMGHG